MRSVISTSPRAIIQSNAVIFETPQETPHAMACVRQAKKKTIIPNIFIFAFFPIPAILLYKPQYYPVPWLAVSWPVYRNHHNLCLSNTLLSA